MLERVAEGETLTVTKDGEPVALVAPLPRHPLNATQLVELFRGFPPVHAESLRRELDSVLEPSL